MKSNKAAIEAIRKQIQRIAFDANLFDLGIADYHHAAQCSKRRKVLLSAIAELEGKPPQSKQGTKPHSRKSEETTQPARPLL